MEGSDSGQPEIFSLQEARPCRETGRDKINGAGGGRDIPRADPSHGGPECEYPCHRESNGQGRKGSADPSSGNFTSPFASKGTCVLEFGQGGGVHSASSEKLCESVCVHGSTLERCVCEALGKEGSCSLTAEHHNSPRILGFHESGLVQGVRRRTPSFSFF